jgi:GNAT superfamily N-acetyltransferase
VQDEQHPVVDDCAARRIFIVRRARSSAATPGESAGPRKEALEAGPAIGRLPRKAVETLRVEGLKAMASKTRAALGSGRAVVVFEMQRERVLKRRSPVPGVTLGLLGRGDIPAFVVLQPGSAEMADARLRRGDRCVAAWKEGRVVGARWLTTVSADIGDIGVSFPVLPEIAYGHDAFTAPEERGRGVGAMVTAALFECAADSGAARVINAVLPENRSGQGLALGRSESLGMLRSNRFGDRLLVRCQIPPGYLGAPEPFRGSVPSVDDPDSRP